MPRLLLLELHQLGDAVMSLPFLRGAISEYEVYVGCSAKARPLYELVLPAERIFTVSFLGPAEITASFRMLKSIRAEVAVSVWADVRDHLLFRALAIPRRIGFPMNEVNYYAHHLRWRRRRLRIGRFFQASARSLGLRLLTDPLRRANYLQHHVEDWKQLSAALNLPFSPRVPWINLTLASLPEQVEKFFREHRNKKIWLLHPGAGNKIREWAHYGRLVDEVFARHSIPLIVIQVPGSLITCNSYPELFFWPGGSLKDFFQLVVRCDFIMGNDTASVHIGAALAKQVITLFGPGSAFWFAPYTPHKTLFESFICPVRPCYDRCIQPSNICLEEVTFDNVSQGILKLFFPS